MKHTADVVIIGGGCMGASVAYHLARRGVTDVVLVERETLLGTGSTGRNAGGVRHQFSNEANIRLSIESIGAARAVRRRGRLSDRLPPGRLSVSAVDAGERRDVSQKRRAAAQPRRGRAVARRRGRGAAGAGARRGRRRRRDVLPARRDRRSQRRHHGVCEDGAGGRRHHRARYGGHRDPRRGRPGRRGRDDARDDRHANGRQRGGSARAPDRTDGRRRRARRSVPPPHLHRRPRRRWRERSWKTARRALVAHHGDRLRHDLLFPSRGRRAALRHGRSQRGADLRHDRPVGFPAAGDRRRRQAPAGAGRRVDLACVGGPL